MFAPLIIAFVAALVLTPQARRAAIHYRVLDWPDATDKRHAQPTPLLGGLAVAGAFAIGILAAWLISRLAEQPALTLTRATFGVALSSAVILGSGVLHEIYRLRARQRLALQMIAVLIVCISGLTINEVNLFGTVIDLGLLAIPFTAAWLLITMNAMNLLDGADGIATAIGMVIAGTVGVMCMLGGQTVEAALAFALAGALAGFLVYNFPPSSIFLGEGGSTLIGLLVGILASQCHVKRSTTVALLPALSLLTIPLLDASAAIVRRVLTGRGIALSDRGHLHHALLRRGWGPRRLIAGMAGLTMISSAAALLGMVTQNSWWSMAGVALVVGVLLFGRVFWWNELVLIASRARMFLLSFVPRTAKRPDQERNRIVGLNDSSQCQEIWEELNAFANEHGLSRLRLDLNGTLMADGHDVLWERVTSERQRENWTARIPVTAFHREFGQLQVGGAVTGKQAAQLMGQLGLLLEQLQPRLEELLQTSTSTDSRGIHRPRVLFLNRSYWPDCEATGQLLTQLCENLADTFDISVLVGQPNANPKNESYVRYGVQTRNGVDIHRVPHTTFNKRSTMGKALNFVSFFFSACWQAVWVPHPQVVIAETDPFLLPLLGGILKQLRGCQLIVYLQDIYPDIAVAIGKAKPGIVTRTLWWMLRSTYNRADKVVVLGEDMRRRLILRGVDASRVVCIPNWIDTDDVYPIKEDNDFRREHGLQDKFVVMHSGNMGLTQELDQLLDVAQEVQDDERIVFLLVGDGASRKRLQERVTSSRLTNVRFLPYQPKEQLALTLSAADLHVVSMHPKISGLLVPSKMYGIMASGTPMLAIVPRTTDAHALVTREKIGFSVRPYDIVSQVTILRECAAGEHDLEAMGERARRLVESDFDFGTSRGAFESVLQKATRARHYAVDAPAPAFASPSQAFPVPGSRASSP